MKACMYERCFPASFPTTQLLFIFQSIYFFDPNGHRLELAVNTAKPGMLDRLHDVAEDMIDEWSETKRAPQHAAWLHENEN